MSTKPLYNSPHSGPEPEAGKQPRLYRLAWACLPAMLALSVVVLLLLGVSWWTALIVVLLLGCPAAMATAFYVGLRPFPGASGPERDHRKRRP
ncbi:MAG: hypothetical protein AAAC48_28640 [Phyllobacterium sp.]|uniref:hypothetical protein n=1 Tax=Phyllobacterium sp. TaxID=1871046 RepID=UPI0030F05AF7